MMLEALGIPLAKTVSNALPGGKLVTGVERNELVCQLVDERKRVCSLPRLINCATGTSLGEFWAPLPPELSVRPRNPAPVIARLLLKVNGEVALLMCGCQAALNHRPTS